MTKEQYYSYKSDYEKLLSCKNQLGNLKTNGVCNITTLCGYDVFNISDEEENSIKKIVRSQLENKITKLENYLNENNVTKKIIDRCEILLHSISKLEDIYSSLKNGYKFIVDYNEIIDEELHNKFIKDIYNRINELKTELENY